MARSWCDPLADASSSAAAASAPRPAAQPTGGAARAAAPATRTTKRAPKPKNASTAPRGRPARSAPKLELDLSAVADIDGLEQEVAVLRASIRQLANNGEVAVHVRVLAELRHQIEALCRALKTRQSLAGHDGDRRTAELAQVLEELGDQLGVPR